MTEKMNIVQSKKFMGRKMTFNSRYLPKPTEIDDELDAFFGGKGYRDERPMTMTQKVREGLR